MEKMWAAHIHLGIVHPMAFPETLDGEGPILETARKICKDAFFSSIEVSWVKDPATRIKLAKMLDAAHLDVIFCGGPPILMQGINLNSMDLAVRNKAVDDVKRLVDEAYDMNAKILVVCSGPDPAREERDQAKDHLIESLREICRYAGQKAKDYTLFVSLENFDRDVHRKLLIGPTAEAVEIAEGVKEDYGNFGLTVDLSHLPLLKENSEEALSLAKDHLCHVHIGNCVVKDRSHPLYGDQHPRFGIGGGENNVKELSYFLKALKDIGYFGRKTATTLPVVSFEVKPTTDETSEIVIANSKRVFLDAWALM
ncbi:MAG: Xylose isomerase-like TIM barrel [Candidatus Bathyarchaeota archaeon BA1]|nr:MAG: Xylose isomerase-like TIM barrel [Candidatus Bathyarchaeota archaeon BA1]